jgi:hypothetical protein
VGATKLMLFKILKLFGLDVRAEIAGVKDQIEQRIDDIAYRSQIGLNRIQPRQR